MDVIEELGQSREQTIRQVRELSRKLVRELGFMRPHLADSGLAPSAVHAIIEVGLTPGIQARELAALLRLDKSNASRQVAKLEAAGLLRRESDPDDARAARLYLTRQGAALRARIDRFATDQVSKALRQLAPGDQQALLRLLALYGEALSRDNPNMADTPDGDDTGGPSPEIGMEAASDGEGRIVEGYLPGCIGDIAALHARYYADAVGFGVFFERKVATELASFAESLPAQGKGMWLYTEQGRVLGSVVIDGDRATREAYPRRAHPRRAHPRGAHPRRAHLRWFIVDGSLRGRGVGRGLLARAMAFADAWYDETYLWTFRGLDAARHLYESVGFQLAEEADGSQWGEPVTEQRFVRRKPAPDPGRRR